MLIEGTIGSAIRKTLEFQVLTCSQDSTLRLDSDPDCALPQDIKGFMSDLHIDVWSVSQQIDFTVYEKEPTHQVQFQHASNLLSDEVTIQESLNIQVHEI